MCPVIWSDVVKARHEGILVRHPLISGTLKLFHLNCFKVWSVIPKFIMVDAVYIWGRPDNGGIAGSIGGLYDRWHFFFSASYFGKYAALASHGQAKLSYNWLEILLPFLSQTIELTVQNTVKYHKVKGLYIHHKSVLYILALKRHKYFLQIVTNWPGDWSQLQKTMVRWWLKSLLQFLPCNACVPGACANEPNDIRVIDFLEQTILWQQVM